MPKCSECGEQFERHFGEANFRVPSLATTCPRCARRIFLGTHDAEKEESDELNRALAKEEGRPILTLVLVGLNVFVFVLMVALGVSWWEPTPQQALLFGADFGPLTLHHQWWRLLTSTFVHFGILHLAANMWCLWEVGRLSERLVGRIAFALLYVSSGLFSSVASLLWHPMAVSAGASGAIFGVAGALLSFLYLEKEKASLNLPAMHNRLIGVTCFVLYNVYSGTQQSGTDNAAHLGGLAMGLAMGSALPRAKDALPRVSGALSILNAVQITPPVSQQRPGLRLKLIAAIALLAIIAGASIAQRIQDPYERQLEQAQGLAQANKLDEAESVLVALSKIERGSRDPRVRYLLGLVKLQQGKDEEATAEFREAIRLNPDYGAAHWMLGVALANQSKLDEAIGELRAATRISPDFAEAHITLGAALNEKGDAKGALEEFRLAQHLSPDQFLAPTLLFAGHTERVWTLRFSRDSRVLASGSLDKTVKVWDVRSGHQLANFNFVGNAWPVDFSPDGKLLVTGSSDLMSKSPSFRIWELSSGSEAKDTKLPSNTNPIAFSPDWHYLASDKGNGAIELWDARQRKPIHLINSGESPFKNYGRFSDDGRLFCAPGASNTAKVWDVQTGKELYTARGDPTAEAEGIVAVFFSADGTQLTVVDSHKNVKISDIEAGRELRTIPVDMGGISIVEHVGLSPDGKWLAAESVGGVVVLTDLIKGRTLTLPGHRHLANAVAFSPDGRWLATASWEGEVKLWQVPSQRRSQF